MNKSVDLIKKLDQLLELIDSHSETNRDETKKILNILRTFYLQLNFILTIGYIVQRKVIKVDANKLNKSEQKHIENLGWISPVEGNTWLDEYLGQVKLNTIIDFCIVVNSSDPSDYFSVLMQSALNNGIGTDSNAHTNEELPSISKDRQISITIDQVLAIAKESISVVSRQDQE